MDSRAFLTRHSYSFLMTALEFKHFQIPKSELSEILSELCSLGFQPSNVSVAASQATRLPVDPLDERTFGMFPSAKRSYKYGEPLFDATVKRDFSNPLTSAKKKYGDAYAEALEEYLSKERNLRTRRSLGLTFTILGFAFLMTGLFLFVGCAVSYLAVHYGMGDGELLYFLSSFILGGIGAIFFILGVVFFSIGLNKYLRHEKEETIKKELATLREKMKETASAASKMRPARKKTKLTTIKCWTMGSLPRKITRNLSNRFYSKAFSPVQYALPQWAKSHFSS